LKAQIPFISCCSLLSKKTNIINQLENYEEDGKKGHSTAAALHHKAA